MVCLDAPSRGRWWMRRANPEHLRWYGQKRRERTRNLKIILSNWVRFFTSCQSQGPSVCETVFPTSPNHTYWCVQGSLSCSLIHWKARICIFLVKLCCLRVLGFLIFFSPLHYVDTELKFLWNTHLLVNFRFHECYVLVKTVSHFVLHAHQKTILVSIFTVLNMIGPQKFVFTIFI